MHVWISDMHVVAGSQEAISEAESRRVETSLVDCCRNLLRENFHQQHEIAHDVGMLDLHAEGGVRRGLPAPGTAVSVDDLNAVDALDLHTISWPDQVSGDGTHEYTHTHACSNWSWFLRLEIVGDAHPHAHTRARIHVAHA